MTIVGLDDTDSRERGMCTTYLATRLADRIADAGGTVERRLLVRLNPAVKHKTRGNAALALHTGLAADEAFALASDAVKELAAVDDPRTSPGVVVADTDLDSVQGVDPDVGPGPESDAIPHDVATFAREALRQRFDLASALALIEDHGYRHAGFGAGGAGGPEAAVEGRGRIGALAAVGAWAAFDEWTHEHISYREFDRCGTPRDVDADSVFTAADWGYPVVWDTVDRGTGDVVCVPNAPGPILHGIRGDDPDVCRGVAKRIDAEPVERSATFLTNQGTDAHLAAGTLGDLREGAGYRVDCVVAEEPETRQGGHVFVPFVSPDAVPEGLTHPSQTVDATFGDATFGDATFGDATFGDATFGDAECVVGAAFEPTKRFRDHVRALRPGDRLTVCGEHEDGTLKLEKFAVREPVNTELRNPTCDECGRSMASAGRGQGYRCRDCGTDAPAKVSVAVERGVEVGWYEVPPCARRHVAKPLIRGGFDAPVHPER